MEVATLTIGFIGALGIGSGIWSIIQYTHRYHLERRKVLFERKLEAFASLTEAILGLASHGKDQRTLFDNLAISAKARLLITDKDLDTKIHNFFVDLDELYEVEERYGYFDQTKYQTIQDLGASILKHLSKDLYRTLS